MNKIIISTSILILLYCGCHNQSIKTWQQEHIPDIDSTPQPNDVYETSPKSGKYNKSLIERRQKEATAYLNVMKNDIKNTPTEELFNLFKLGLSYEGVDYYVARDGNKLLVEELRQRGASIKDILEKYKNDTRIIFTGSSGPSSSIGTVCNELLRKAD
ncbi:MAG TPA: hypothetical protein DCZ94_04930 [Lentisphaeria bacterium]|nr:MAG: hypothetical protein A2X48_07880 [Lentisphaerae bacterium GWF2_49_21]HBC86281.1 hypothetical protein [Lentisphaeria bacterium]